jgi:hypothetical protein
MKCEYGCNQEAKFQTKIGKWICSKSPNCCPINKEKNSKASKKTYQEGRKPALEALAKGRAWAKGLTKETSESLRRVGEHTSKRLLALGENNPYVLASKERSKTKNHPAHLKQSETRIRLYKEGKLTPAKGVGRGKYSYFIYENKKYLLRSTFEFIFALYLAYKKISFKYENIRVQYENATRINDFEINNKIYEIKGYGGSHVDEVVKAFKYNNYQIRVIFWPTIEEIKKYLERHNFPMDDILNQIKEGHKTKNYFIFDCSKML